MPFAERISFTQPDGTQIELWGEGDEFHAVFETLDGYSVVFDAPTKTYHFAKLSANGNDLISTGIPVHRANGEDLGVVKHLRPRAEAVKSRAAERRKKWDEVMEVSKRWAALKDAARQRAEGGIHKAAPPRSPTIGIKTGLCLLIDFDDDAATIPQAEIFDYCNGDNYTGYGNNGSVKKYFQDVSNGLLTYSNVVTIYIRIPNSLHPKSYYNDTSLDNGAQANLLIRDAINILTNRADYATLIRPAFDALTVDANNNIVACNVYYAGGNGGVWSQGLWPHSWSLYNVGAQALWPGGKKVYRYQVTNIGTSLRLSTFCHENGHLLCGFPDIYDYDYDSTGGAGRFCLMNSSGSGTNPTQPCGYLKRAAGWASTTELTSSSQLRATLSATQGSAQYNRFYRYQKPGVSTEYFLLENRQQTGRDAGIPSAGIAIWHIDELGDKDDQRMIPNSVHNNYEVTLVQADNKWHFQANLNSGDATDLFFLGNTAAAYRNQFSDQTFPSAQWWDGSPSGLKIRNISLPGDTIYFSVGEADYFHVLEAESGTLAAPMAVLADPQAANGQYVASGTPGAGSASFTFQVPQTNTYLIWCRVLVTSTNENALRVSMDGGAVDVFDVAEGTPSNAWQWVVVNGRGPSGVPLAVNPRSFPLTPGTHTLVFQGEERNTRLDRLLITSDLYYAPDDTAPVIVSEPQDARIMAGAEALFSVSATHAGAAPMFYQWWFNGGQLANQTNGTYSLPNTQTNASGEYRVVVSNYFGAVTSRVANLLVVPAPRAWAAYNDHFTGPGTHTNTTAWNVFDTSDGAPGFGGPLKDIATGVRLPTSLTITNSGIAGGTTSGAPLPNTPAYRLFNGFVDFGSGTIDHAVQIGSAAAVGYVFSGLNPAKRYAVYTTAVRGGSGGTYPNNYTNRWTRVELAGADSFADAHSLRVLTSAQAPGSLASNAVALNSGANTGGELVAWDNVDPGADGTLTLIASRFTNAIPPGWPASTISTNTGDASGYAYALSALRLDEVDATAPPVILVEPTSRGVLQGFAATLTVVAANYPGHYQWFKDGVALAQATNSTFAITAFTTNHGGAYVVVVDNANGAVTSQVAMLSLMALPPGWVAFNDHAAGGGTHAFATRWNVFGTSGGAPGAGGSLKNILNGSNLTARLDIYNTGAVAGNSAASPAPGSPAYEMFNGYVDFQGSPNRSVEMSGTANVAYNFSMLNPARRYRFHGTAIRGDAAYTDRWTRFEITGATAFSNAHTANAYTSGMASNQVAVNVGANSSANSGDMAVWEEINPGSDGTFRVTCVQYTGTITGGGMASGSKSYGMTGIRLEELPPSPIINIVGQPTNQMVTSGSSVSFAVAATSEMPLAYQWTLNSYPIGNATNATLNLTNVQTVNAGAYQAVISNSLNSVTSAPAILEVLWPPVFSVHPRDQTALGGSDVSFSAAAVGSQPMSYQWRLNDTNLFDSARVSGATNETLYLRQIRRLDAGLYTLVASNVDGMATSSPARLNVQAIQFTPPIMHPAQGFHLQLHGERDLRMEIQASSNLFNWAPLAVLTNEAGAIEYQDTVTNHARRFYRAVEKP